MSDLATLTEVVVALHARRIRHSFDRLPDTLLLRAGDVRFEFDAGGEHLEGGRTLCTTEESGVDAVVEALAAGDRGARERETAAARLADRERGALMTRLRDGARR